MPERSTSQQSQQQFWTPDQRTQILNYVNERAHDAIDEKGLDADVEARDRALVAVLAFTGVRASEVFRSEHDNRTGRQGIRWRDVDLDEQTISVLGKNQQRQSAWLLEQAIPAVERYRTISDPPSDDWPVFPTKHAPSLYQCARTHLREVEHEDEEATEVILEENSIEKNLCSSLRDDPGVNAFIATDPDIPLPEDKDAEEPVMNAIAQSKAYAEASNAIAFVLPIAGLRDGVSAEIGAVLEAMDLENGDPGPSVKDPRRFRIFAETGITSTTIYATEDEYSVPIVEYSSKEQLRKELHEFVTNVAILEQKGILPPVQEESNGETS